MCHESGLNLQNFCRWWDGVVATGREESSHPATQVRLGSPRERWLSHRATQGLQRWRPGRLTGWEGQARGLHIPRTLKGNWGATARRPGEAVVNGNTCRGECSQWLTFLRELYQMDAFAAETDSYSSKQMSFPQRQCEFPAVWNSPRWNVCVVLQKSSFSVEENMCIMCRQMCESIQWLYFARKRCNTV